MQNNRKSFISNQIAKRPIRSILGLCDVTLPRNVQIHEGINAFLERAGLLYTREMLAVSFDRLVSHLVLVVGLEIHAESFLIAQCLVCGTCACTYLNGKLLRHYIQVIDTRQTLSSLLRQTNLRRSSSNTKKLIYRRSHHPVLHQ